MTPPPTPVPSVSTIRFGDAAALAEEKFADGGGVGVVLDFDRKA